MEEEQRKSYAVKNRSRFIAVLGAAAGLVILLVGGLFLLRCRRGRVVDLAAYTAVTRAGDTVTAVLDVDSLLTDLQLPNPRISEFDLKRHPDVAALASMEMALFFTEDPEIMEIEIRADEAALRRRGIRLKQTRYQSPVKVLPRAAAPAPEEPDASMAPAVESPQTVLADGYLTSLLDEEGKGLNLHAVCERVHFERDRVAKEIFGNNYGTKKTHVWFIVYPEGSEAHNGYRAVYSLYETGMPEGRSVQQLYFTVDVLDLAYTAEAGVRFRSADVALYDTEEEASALDGLSEIEASGGQVIDLVGGVRGEERPAFDYNGFVRFVGLPMSYPLPNGQLWSPTSDPLNEDDLWRLVGNGEYTMAELLAFARMEIYARRNYSFPGQEQQLFRDHFSAYPWYVGDEPAPERFMTVTERKNIELLRTIEAFLET